jgi:uncharacterized protein YdaT
MPKNYHVVRQDEKWAVKSEGAERASKVVNTQSEAIDVGRELAQKNNSELLIHGKDNRIRRKHSYGNDPYPPKG